ncbi:MAG TPA: hypothetical protein PLF26_08160 [Blastocatellia bacterium]|nr:hypothetical protein [Blastocatellia bacterium]
MKSIRFTVSVLCAGLFVVASLCVVPEAQAQRSVRQKPRITMTNPSKGSVVHPGDQVEIRWEYNVTPSGDQAWCEQEIYLSLDGGATNDRRLTLALDPAVRSYMWTVPDVASDRAVLDIHYGCETTNFPHEVPNVQKSAPFKIVRGSKTPQGIKVNAPAKAAAGTVITIDWNSTVDNVGSFEVLVSYDRGAHFTSIGTSQTQSFSWTAPADYAGTAMFRVIAHRPDGTSVPSEMIFGELVTIER